MKLSLLARTMERAHPYLYQCGRNPLLHEDLDAVEYSC